MRPRPRFAHLAALAMAALLGLADAGSTAAQSVGALGVFTLSQDRLFAESAFGKRVLAEMKARSDAVSVENRRIEDELKAEELDLTEKRPTLAPEEFRKLADTFDTKVEAIRKAQAQKASDINGWAEQERQRFFKTAFPILVKLAGEVGAGVILDQRATIISADQTDLTLRAIARIDAEIGDGSDGSDGSDGGDAPAQ